MEMARTRTNGMMDLERIVARSTGSRPFLSFLVWSNKVSYRYRSKARETAVHEKVGTAERFGSKKALERRDALHQIIVKTILHSIHYSTLVIKNELE